MLPCSTERKPPGALRRAARSCAHRSALESPTHPRALSHRVRAHSVKSNVKKAMGGRDSCREGRSQSCIPFLVAPIDPPPPLLTSELVRRCFSVALFNNAHASCRRERFNESHGIPTRPKVWEALNSTGLADVMHYQRRRDVWANMTTYEAFVRAWACHAVRGLCGPAWIFRREGCN